MIDRVRGYCQSQRLLRDDELVLVGFSGGPDSTALLLVLQAMGVRLLAVHFHHGLRGEADADANWCRDFCEERKIPFLMQPLDVPNRKEAHESIEMAARRLRLCAWRQLVSDRNAGCVALGHHRDDVIETTLMRLFRGANASGLTGLRAKRHLMGVTFVRPMLQTRRSEIEAYLRNQQIQPRHDASNEDGAFLRNRVRNELLPLIDEMFDREGVARSADYLLDDALILERLAMVGSGLTVSQLRAAEPGLRLRMLRSWAAAAGHGELVLGAGSASKLHAVLDGPSFSDRREIEVDETRVLVLDHDQLNVAESADISASAGAVVWDWRSEPSARMNDGRRLVVEEGSLDVVGDDAWVVFDGDALPCPLILRGRQPGDRMVPFGGSQSVRVKKLLANTKLPLADRNQAIVVTGESGEILWLAPYRRSSAYPVTSTTTRVVRMRLERLGNVG